MKKRLILLLLYPLLITGLVLTAVRYLTCVISSPGKAWHIALMIDQTCNVDANGRVDQTISDRAALARNSGRRWGCVLCRILDAIQANHCSNSIGT